jgi:thiosulfate/3-mercaptopyruvate sulfurtransferase
MRAPAIMLLTIALFCSSASAECYVCTFLDNLAKETITSIFSSDSISEAGIADSSGQLNQDGNPAVTEDSEDMVAPSREVLINSSDVTDNIIMLDGSDYPASFIPGAVHISYREFVDINNTACLKNISDIARILGDAGISRTDPLVVYGECQPCGGGPSTATYVYWLLRYMGHEDLRVLNGGIDAWMGAGLPVENSSATRPKSTYSPAFREDLYATYDYVKSGKAQIVDARSVEEFKHGTIPGAVNIPYDEALDGKVIQEESELEGIFSNLTKNKPVVVFTTTGTKASVIWFSLDMLSYDAKMYTYRDWQKAEREERRQLEEMNRSK